MARHSVMWLAAAAALCVGCSHSDTNNAGDVLASSLTSAVTFTHGVLLNDPLPETTDPRATLLPLGPTVVMQPSQGSLMAIEVDDPDQREVAATLIQFEGEGSHTRVPDDQSSMSPGVVENDFIVAKNLCKGLCNAIFTVHVQEKVELADGKISDGTTRDVVVDCRKSGDPASCPPKGSNASGRGVQSLCGDVTMGEIALSGDHPLDAYLDAVRQLSKVAGSADTKIKSALSAIATNLKIDPQSSAADIASALTARIDQDTEGGLTLLLGQPGCATRLEQVSLALRVCDPTLMSLGAMQCEGTCVPTSDTAVCAGAPSSGCRGVLDGAQCDGSCVGACESTLAMPAVCDGTCIGSCDGPCPDDGTGGCAGPCTGNCTGKCRTVNSGSCDGDCTGLCDVMQMGEPSCDAPLAGYCDSGMDSGLACPGDCFGGASVDQGLDVCRVSALSLAASYPRCEAPLVQLSFAFKSGLDSAEQADFATFVRQVNVPLVKLYDALGRIGLLSAEAMALSSEGQGAIADELSTKLASAPEDSGLGCANRRLPETSSWLDDEQTLLMSSQADAVLVLSAFTVTH